jgi:O-antigen ligase
VFDTAARVPVTARGREPLGFAVVDAPREAARRPSAPALALLVPWLALALVSSFRDGGSSPTGLAVAAVGAILASLVALTLTASGRIGLPRPSRAGLIALAGVALWGSVAFASIAWSLSPAASWKDAIHVACAAAAIAGGIWIGALLRRPAQAACLVLAVVAVTIAIYSIAQRSFSSEFIAPAFPRLREPFGYANALASLFASGVPTALVLGTRREPLVRALAAAAVCALIVALVLTGSRGGILATLVAIIVVLVLAGRRLELVATLAAGALPALPVALYGVSLPTFSGSEPPPSAGAGLLLLLLAALACAAALGVVAQLRVGLLSPPTRARVLHWVELGAGALVILGLIVASVRAGGPIELVSRSWDQLTGNGQVSNATGSRFFTFSSNLRYRWWSEAWHAFTLRPVEGFGAGTFNLIDQLSRPDAIVAREAHSSGLQVLSGLGLLGGIPALAGLAGAVAACIGGWRRLAGEERVAAAALCAVVAGLALHAQLDWDWTFAAITLIGYPIPGILASAGRGTARAPAFDRWMAGAALPLLAVLAIACMLPLLSDRATTRADDLLAQDRTDPALVESDLAVSLDPLSTGALLDRATILQLLGRPKDAAADVRRALRLEPANADTWAQAADLQRGQWHDPKGACKSAQTAHALAPFNTSMAATAIEYCTPAAREGASG